MDAGASETSTSQRRRTPLQPNSTSRSVDRPRKEIGVQTEQRRELAVFLFLTFVLAPLLAVIIVAGYGFCVWMYQLVAGPPSV